MAAEAQVTLVFGPGTAVDGVVPLAALGAPDDAGTPYVARATSDWLTPDGEGGEAVFRAVYLAVTWSAECNISVTPIVEERAEVVPFGELRPHVAAVALPAIAGGQRRSDVIELPLAFGLYVDDVAEAIFDARGTRLRVQVEIALGGAGSVILDGMDVDVSPVREGRALAGTAAPVTP